MGKRGRPSQHAERLVICSVWQCPFPARTMGMCHKHHTQWWRWHRKKEAGNA